MLAALPLLGLVVIAYNVLVLVTGSALGAVLVTLPLLSGDSFAFTLADLLLAAGLVLLYAEVVKSTRTGSASIVDHLLSLVLFVICLLEFVALPGFGTGTFLLLTLMTFIDVIAGFTVTISAARRDIGYDGRGVL